MTLAPEAKLAREAEMCLCGILTVTDYDCWYEGKEDVSVASIVENLKKNDTNMANIIKRLIPKIKYRRTCGCHTALEYGVITSPELMKKNGNPRVNRVLLKRFIK
jgi:5'-methylthioadenosine phosphorylase